MQALRKSMQKKSTKGVGMAILSNRIYNKGWRPLLPIGVKKNFPKLHNLIVRCWLKESEARQDFEEVVKLLQGEILEEVMKGQEPEIVVLSEEDDKIYLERMELGEEAEVGETVGEEGEEGEGVAEVREEHRRIIEELKLQFKRREEELLGMLEGKGGACIEKKEEDGYGSIREKEEEEVYGEEVYGEEEDASKLATMQL